MLKEQENAGKSVSKLNKLTRPLLVAAAASPLAVGFDRSPAHAEIVPENPLPHRLVIPDVVVGETFLTANVMAKIEPNQVVPDTTDSQIGPLIVAQEAEYERIRKEEEARILAEEQAKKEAEAQAQAQAQAANQPTVSPQEYSGNSVWDALAHCESTSRWSLDSGNGFYGGLQFTYNTWHSYGGGAYAEYPHHATREQQIEIAEKALAGQGWESAWPACSAELGLR